MFTFIESIKDKDAFITRLFEAPTDKAVLNSNQKNLIDPETFYQAATHFYNRHLGGFDLLPIQVKKFPRLIVINDDIKTALKHLTVQDKFNKSIRPAITNVFYNAAENMLVATDCHIIFCWKSFRHFGGYKAIFGDQNLMLNIDNLGNITQKTEKEYKEGKYPDYNSCIPENVQTDLSFTIDETRQNILFHFIKCAKVIGIDRPVIKIGSHYFNAHLLCRLLMAFKAQRPNVNLILSMPENKNKVAYLSSIYGDHKGVVMPLAFEDKDVINLHYNLF
jgi:hypothetical protein